MICTRATADSMAYDDAFAAAPHVTLHTRACPRFVEFVEAGVTSGPELMAVAHEYLDPLTAAGVDTLILGCTHYPLLTGVMSYVMGDEVTLVSQRRGDRQGRLPAARPARPRARRALPAPVHRFLTTGQPEEFAAIGRRFLGPELESVHQLAGRPRSWVARMRLTVVGCSGSFAGPDSAAQLLPPRGRAATAAPGGCCSTSAAAPSARCSATSTR